MSTTMTTYRVDGHVILQPLGYAAAKERIQLPCHMMPYKRNPHFLGQESIMNKLRTGLLPAPHSKNDSVLTEFGRVYSIYGMGGIGKTQIALEFAYRYQYAFDAVFWIRADTEKHLEEDFTSAASTLGLLGKESPNTPIGKQILIEWLNKPRRFVDINAEDQLYDVSWLLIFDNVEEAASLLKF
jgi:hypothetical protein